MTTTGLLLMIPLAGWLVVALMALIGVWLSYIYMIVNPAEPGDAALAVIIPIRGVSANLPAFWEALCGQTYRRARLIFSVELAADPAHAALSRLIATPGAPPAEIVVAGPTVDCAQKVHNQLAALRRLKDEDELVVFADADMVPPADWLARAVELLADPEVDIVSGYRWLFPADDRFSTALLCLGNASVATLPRIPILNLAWGGTMALRHATLREIDLERVWRGAITDDLSLTRAIWARHKTVLSRLSLILPSPVAPGWRGGFAFARRQYQIIQVYTPLHWWIAAAGTTLPLLGWVVALPLAAQGSLLAWGTILIANLFDQGRCALRRRIIRGLLGEGSLERLRRVLWLDRYATPASLLYHSAAIWSSRFGRTITWADRVYRVRGPNRLEVVAAPAMPPETPSAG